MAPPTEEDPRDDEALMKRLFAAVGHRQMPDEAALGRAEDAFRQALAPIVQRKRRGRTLALFSVAATVALAVAVGVVLSDQRSALPKDAAIATLVESVGPVEFIDGSPANAASAIHVGQVLMTGSTGRAAIRYREADVRVDVASTIRFDPARLVLERGAIYVDTGAARSVDIPPVLVETPFGMLGHTGTQFMARLDADHLIVGVREGTVFVKSGSDRRDMSAQPRRASVAEVDASGSIVVHDDYPHGGMWSWVTQLASNYAVEGRSVDAYLAWLGREYGYAVEFDGPSSEARARTTLLHGDIHPLSLDEALAMVNATTHLVVGVDQDALRVGLESNHDADPRHDRE